MNVLLSIPTPNQMLRWAVVNSLGLFFLSCATAPVMAQVDTTSSQTQIKQTADKLDQVKPANVSDGVAMGRAVDQLRFAADEIAGLTKKYNSCVSDYQALEKKYEKSQDEGGSFWTRTKRAFSEYWHVLATAVIAFVIGTLFGRAILSILWGAVKGALHIP